MTFKIKNLPIDGLKLIKNIPFKDNRGVFTKFYSKESFDSADLKFFVKQVNFSENIKKGVIRGMHYQEDELDGKIISCITGSIFDVALDLRKNSKTFLKFFSIILDSKNNSSFFIPPGFAHGFQSLEKNSKILYLHDKEYFPELNKTINPLDKKIGINWPQKKLLISVKDSSSSYLEDNFEGLNVNS